MSTSAETTAVVLQQPNATLYVKNIDWKVKKPLLRRALYSLFSRHGKVLEIIALRRTGLRGQAWVIFDDITAATAALQAEQGFTFFGKDMVLEYALEKSDRIAKRDGTYVPKERRPKKVKPDPSQQENNVADGQVPDQDAAAAAAAGTAPPPPEAPTAPPSKYLLAQDLPAACNDMMLAMLFRQYQGFQEVRMPRPGLAFVEFDDEPSATQAMKGLSGFKLTGQDTLKLDYGKA